MNTSPDKYGDLLTDLKELSETVSLGLPSEGACSADRWAKAQQVPGECPQLGITGGGPR